jgi:DHA1 family tetracycline resistance protein-like MFS transporter
LFATLLPILGITFIDIIGFSILIPILPYFVEHFGVSKVVVGMLFSTFALCQFIAGPIWGHVSDRIGRKSVLIISQIGATIGWAMLAFAPTIAWVFVARIIEGLSGGNISVTQAYVADRVPPEHRAKAFAWIGAAFSGGMILGPAAGGFLLSRFGFATPFLLAAGMQVVTLLLTVFLLPESFAKDGEKNEAAGFAEIGRALANPQTAPILLQKLAYSLGLYAWFAAFALVLQAQLGFGATATSYFFACFGAVSIVIQLFFVGRLVDKLGNRRTSNVGFTCAVAFFAFIPLVSTIAGLAGTIVLFALGLSITNATLAALLAAAAPEHARGTVLGVGASLESIAGIVMPSISTAVLAAYGTPWTAGISAFFCAIALGLGLLAQRRDRRSPEAQGA